MKKLICLVLAVAAMLSFSACGFTDLYSQPATLNTTMSSSKKVDIALNANAITLNVGDTYQLADTAEMERTLTWTSSNEAVVLVNSTGLVTAAGPGVANIICSTDGASDASCTVTVNEAPTSPTVPTTQPTTAPIQEATTGTVIYIPTPPSGGTPTYSSDFIFPSSSVSYLTEAEIRTRMSTMSGYSPTGSYIQDAINEIYARNGYVFQSSTISAFYNAKSWYTPNPSFTISHLSSLEQSNIALLKKFM